MLTGHGGPGPFPRRPGTRGWPMLELLLCSLAHDPPGLPLPPLRAGEAARQGDNLLLGLVRAPVGHHGLPDADRRPDHGHLLQPPVHHQRHRVLPNGAHRARGQRPRRRDVSWASRTTIKQGQPIFRLDSSKQEAAVEAARKKIAEVDAEMVVAKADIAAAEGKIQEAKGRLPAGRRRTGNQAGAATPQSGHGRRPATSKSCSWPLRDGKAPSSRRRPQRRPPWGVSRPCFRPRRQAPRPLSTSSGRTGQDRNSSGRERAGGAVRVARRRHRQSVHAARRGADSGGRRAAAPAGRLRPDRGAGHEGRDDRGGHLRIKAVDGHPAWWSRVCRTSSPPASSAAGSNWSIRSR